MSEQADSTTLPSGAVRVLVVQTDGSAPREAGAAMTVSASAFSGTIGGGALEYQAIAAARELLAQSGLPAWHRELRSYPLGPALGQCCGGMVRLVYEVQPTAQPKTQPGAGVVVRPLTPGIAPVIVRDRAHAADWPLPVLRAIRQMLSGERPRQTLLVAGNKRGVAYAIEPEARPPHPLYLYGAGHVGRAVVRALQDLPFAVTWIDIAADRFPEVIPPSATATINHDPSALTAKAPPEALHLIMTFSHGLDLAITAAVLSRRFAWAGLIGSATKRARFEKRLREAGIADDVISRLHCPIGIGGITGKEPAMIAVSVAAQLAAWASQQAAGTRSEGDRREGALAR